MPLAVAVYKLEGSNRSQKLAEKLAEGIKRAGDAAIVRMAGAYRSPDEDVAAFYGYEGKLPQIMRDFKAAGKKVVYLDLGYWGRRHGGRMAGYHKVAINSRHPTEYVMKGDHPGNRLGVFGLKAKPWKKTGKHILLAGMSDRAARASGFGPAEFEKWAVEEIRKHTNRPIIYRPKPSWKGAKGIHGTHFSPPTEALSSVLSRRAWAVVTHHSNVAIDGLVEGVPAFCWEGAAKPLSRQNLAAIEDPIYPKGRQQFLQNLAYAQWCVPEIECGAMWRHLKNAGLIP